MSIDHAVAPSLGSRCRSAVRRRQALLHWVGALAGTLAALALVAGLCGKPCRADSPSPRIDGQMGPPDSSHVVAGERQGLPTNPFLSRASCRLNASQPSTAQTAAPQTAAPQTAARQTAANEPARERAAKDAGSTLLGTGQPPTRRRRFLGMANAAPIYATEEVETMADVRMADVQMADVRTAAVQMAEGRTPQLPADGIAVDYLLHDVGGLFRVASVEHGDEALPTPVTSPAPGPTDSRATDVPGSIPSRPMLALRASAALPEGILPDDDARATGNANLAADFPSDARLHQGWALHPFTWAPTNLCHRPLYFEQTNLERHGYTVGPCLQPIVSAAHFFAVIPALPYKMTVDRPRSCSATLGYYRPGSWAPRRWHGLPCHNGAAAVEAATAVGLVLLLP